VHYVKRNIPDWLKRTESCSGLIILFFSLFQVVIPDTEFIINLGDWPLILKTKNPEEQVTILSNYLMSSAAY
jgi:hypothetical protein